MPSARRRPVLAVCLITVATLAFSLMPALPVRADGPAYLVKDIATGAPPAFSLGAAELTQSAVARRP